MTTTFDHILSIARDQLGYFATYQLDIERQYIQHHVKAGRLESVMRGLYRVVDFPTDELEELMVARLWADEEAVASHQTALALYELSDVLPQKIDLTVPCVWERRRRNIPKRFRLHYADLGSDEVRWHGPVPVTTVVRTFVDLVDEGFEPDLFDQALNQAIARGLVPNNFANVLLHMVMDRRRADRHA